MRQAQLRGGPHDGSYVDIENMEGAPPSGFKINVPTEGDKPHYTVYQYTRGYFVFLGYSRSPESFEILPPLKRKS